MRSPVHRYRGGYMKSSLSHHGRKIVPRTERPRHASRTLVVFSAHEVNLNAMAGSVEASGNLQADATGYVHVGSMFTLESICFGENREQSFVIVLPVGGDDSTPSTPPMANTKRLTPGSSDARR